MIPPVIRTTNLPPHSNARNNLFCIRIRPDLKYFDAILAQETFEWWYWRKWATLLGSPFIALAAYSFLQDGDGFLFLGIAASIIAFAFHGRLFYAFPSLTRRMEIIGHTIEWIVATEQMGAPKASYLESEARALTRYKQFDGWTLEQCMDAMVEAEPVARKHI